MVQKQLIILWEKETPTHTIHKKLNEYQYETQRHKPENI